MTAFASAETEEAAKAAGLRHVVSKPVDVPKLMSLVEEAISE